MADFKDVKLSEGGDKVNPTDVERLDDYHEAEFRGATLSLSEENNPQVSPSVENAVASATGAGGNSLGPTPTTGPTVVPNQEDNRNSNPQSDPSAAPNHRTSSFRGMSADEIREFFAVRSGALESAADQCRPVILENLDGELRGTWLLTEIDHWDNEKERIIFLTDYSLLVLKYDFITLRLLDYKRLHLKEFDNIIIGELKYPDKSLMPKITGAVDFIKGRVIPKIRQVRTPPNEAAPIVAQPPPPQPTSTGAANEDNGIGTRARNQIGVRCMWNQGQPLPFLKNWNPWSREIPWVTYTSHPLARQEAVPKSSYDIEDFARKLAQTVENLDLTKAPPHDMLTPLKTCDIEYQPILIENYAGIVAAFHNANDFGFFKARGKNPADGDELVELLLKLQVLNEDAW